MTEEKKEESDPFDSIKSAQEHLAQEAGALMDYQHLITLNCAARANDWIVIAEAFQLQARRAFAQAEACAYIGRKSAMNVADLITASYGLDDDEAYETDSDIDEDDDDDDDD